MRIIVGCEVSQVVTKAFRERGHEAYSCDLLPTEGNPDWHFQEDVLKVLEREGFDLGIFFPDCTHLTSSGAQYWAEKQADGRQQAAINFVLKLWDADIPKISLENPTGILSTVWRKPDQIIHPYYFGDPFMKRTCLWLKNLPRLQWNKTDTLFEQQTAVEPAFHFTSNSYRSGMRKDGTRPISKLPVFKPWDSAQERSRSFGGIARAMAEQWSEDLTAEKKRLT